MIRSPAFVVRDAVTERPQTNSTSNNRIIITATTSSNNLAAAASHPSSSSSSSNASLLNVKMVAGIPHSQSWHSLGSLAFPSKPKKHQCHQSQQQQQPQSQSQRNRTTSASSSRSNSGKSSGYGSSLSTPGQFLNVRPSGSKSNGASPAATASAHACRRCGNLLCRWRKTQHNVVVCGAGGVGKSALLVQYLTHRFIYDYDPTLEENYRSFLSLDGCCAELDITELAGQNITDCMALFRSQLLSADGIIVVYDITDPSTLAEAEQIIDIIQRNILTTPSGSQSNRSSTSESVRSSLIAQYGRPDSDEVLQVSQSSSALSIAESWQESAASEEQPAQSTPKNSRSSSASPFRPGNHTDDRTDSSTPVVARQSQAAADDSSQPSRSPGAVTVAADRGGESPPGAAPTQSHVIPSVQVQMHHSRSRDSLDLLADTSFPPIILVGNKCDLESERRVSTRDARQVSWKMGCFFDEASARSGHDDVDRVMAMLVHLMRHPQAVYDGTFSPATPSSRPGTPNNLFSERDQHQQQQPLMQPSLPWQRPVSLSSAGNSSTLERPSRVKRNDGRRRSFPNIRLNSILSSPSHQQQPQQQYNASGTLHASIDALHVRTASLSLSPSAGKRSSIIGGGGGGGTGSSRHQWWLRASLRGQLMRFQSKLRRQKSSQ